MNQIAEVEIKTPLTITPEDVKQYICPLASDKEIFMFLQICKMFELNPFKREVYLVKYKEGQPASTLVGYETYLKRAERSKNWDGFEAITEGRVEDGSLKAIVKIFRKDWNHPFTHEVYYSEYVQHGFKDGKKYVNKFWAEKPQTMIKKVALSQAFRLCFPDEFGGMPYTREEFNDAEYAEAKEINHSKPSNIKEPVAKKQEMPTPSPIKASEEMAKQEVVKLDPKKVEAIEKVALKAFNKSKSKFQNWLWKEYDIADVNVLPEEKFDDCVNKLDVMIKEQREKAS